MINNVKLEEFANDYVVSLPDECFPLEEKDLYKPELEDFIIDHSKIACKESVDEVSDEEMEDFVTYVLSFARARYDDMMGEATTSFRNRISDALEYGDGILSNEDKLKIVISELNKCCVYEWRNY